MLAERRVIPFLGAGFSAALHLPGWDETLSRLCSELEDAMTYEDLRRMCNNDLLQMAEYLYLRADRSIGPIRHRLSLDLQAAESPVTSTAHVELVNLAAPQIYTTNYDELIERTFRDLHQPVDVVALPKHVALANTRKTQVVKYHGDLRYDSTLVLTESSYYTRLDFESPMDLKFRSDLLGRSVLFMGYSFRDINIRIIWFKLMQMMKDIPSADRPRSYIVRFEKNPVLETLYESVGLRTIVLDPKGDAHTDEDRNKIFGQLMLELALRTSSSGRVSEQKPAFISGGLIEAISDELTPESKTRRVLGRAFGAGRLTTLIGALSERTIPAALAAQIPPVLHQIVRVSNFASCGCCQEIFEGIWLRPSNYVCLGARVTKQFIPTNYSQRQYAVGANLEASAEF